MKCQREHGRRCCWARRLRLLAAVATALGAGRRCGELSEQADPRDRAVRGRRRQRHLRAPGRQQAVGNPRPAGHQREQAGRRRPDRRRVRDEPAARRLHDVHRRERRDVGRGRGLSEPVLSSDQDIHSAVDDRELPADPRRAGGSSGEERQGAGRVGEEESRTRRTTPRPRRPSSPRPNCSSSRAACRGR